MPATELTPVAAALTGANPGLTAVDGSNGNCFLNNKNSLLIVSNGSGGSINVTVAPVLTARPSDGVFPAATQASIVVAVPNGAIRLIGPFPACFNDATGKVTATFSSGSSVTAGVIQT